MVIRNISGHGKVLSLRPSATSLAEGGALFYASILPNSPVAHHTVTPSICQPRVAFAGRRQSISAAPLFFKNAFTLPNGAEPKNPR